MDNIPTRKTAEQFQGEVAKIRRFLQDEERAPDPHAHRDDYYIFLLIEKGRGNVLIDFEEREVNENSVFYILPGQVHISGVHVRAEGWFLAVDSMIVREEYKEIFEKYTFSGGSIKTDESVINDLKNCASIIYNLLTSDKKNDKQLIIQDLLSSYVGMIAAIFILGLLSFRPIISPSEDDCTKITGILKKSKYIEDMNDFQLKLEGNEKIFYINNIKQNALNIDSLLGKEITIYAVKHWTLLDPNSKYKHVARLNAGDNVIYTEY